MQIVNAIPKDFDRIFELYDKAIDFQKTKFDKHWLGFDAVLINREIDENRLWKILEDDEAVCIFSVAYSDPMIWGKRDADGAMYIHRIVTDPVSRVAAMSK